MIEKRNHIRSKAIRESARDESCCWPGCYTLAQCWAHSNLQSDGKGTGIKAEDIYGAYLCQYHHDCYDGRENTSGEYKNSFDRQWYFDQAMKKSWKKLINKGIIIVKDYKK